MRLAFEILASQVYFCFIIKVAVKAVAISLTIDRVASINSEITLDIFEYSL